MSKKPGKTSSEDEIFALVSKHFESSPPAAEPSADFIGIGRHGVTYIFQAKPIGEELPEEMDFAAELRQAIAESGVSQLQLAKHAGVPQPAISNFMSGRDIKLQTFNRLAAVLGFELKHKRSKMPKKKAPSQTKAKD